MPKHDLETVQGLEVLEPDVSHFRAVVVKEIIDDHRTALSAQFLERHKHAEEDVPRIWHELPRGQFHAVKQFADNVRKGQTQTSIKGMFVHTYHPLYEVTSSLLWLRHSKDY